MNTKHTRVVVALLLAVSALATMGFRAPPKFDRAASILADHAVCESIEPSFWALEELSVINDSCYADLVDTVENEIGWAFSGQASGEALLDNIYASRRSTGATPYLELLSSEIDMSRFIAPVEPSPKIKYPELLTSEIELNGVFASPSAGLAVRSKFTGVPELTEADRLEMELDRGLVATSSFEDLLANIYARDRSTVSVEYLQLLEVQTDSFIRPVASSVERSEFSQAFLDYHDPRSPWADPK